MKKSTSSFSLRLRSGGLAGTLATTAAVSNAPLMTANAAVIYSGAQHLDFSNSAIHVNVDKSGPPDFTLTGVYKSGTFTSKASTIPTSGPITINGPTGSKLGSSPSSPSSPAVGMTVGSWLTQDYLVTTTTGAGFVVEGSGSSVPLELKVARSST